MVSSMVVLGGLGAAPVGRAATGGWQAASILAAGSGSNTTVALGADGTAVAAWDGSVDRYAAVRMPGSSDFGQPVDLGNAQEGGGQALATNANGDSVMAWRAEAPNSAHQMVFDVEVDYRPAGAQFSASTVATVPGSEYAVVGPVVRFLPDGTAVVAWGGQSGGQYVIEDSVRPPGPGSQFGAPSSFVLGAQTVPYGSYPGMEIGPGPGDSATLFWPDVDTNWISSDEYVVDEDLMIGRVDAQGNITAASVPGSSTEEHVVQSSQSSISGTELGGYGYAGDQAGDLAVVWDVNQTPGSSTASGPVYGSYAPSGQPFQTTPDLINANAYSGAPITGSMLASGTAVFASEWTTAGAQYLERTKSAASFPTTLASLPGPSDASDPQLTAGAGQTIVEYQGDGQLGLYSAVAPDGQPFGSPTLLADTGEESIALTGDGNGNALTAFDGGSGNNPDLMADTYLASPGTGTASAGPGSPAPSVPTARSSSGPAEAAGTATGGDDGPAGIANLKRFALRLAGGVARVTDGRATATLPARCLTAPADRCTFRGSLFASRWQPRTRTWVKTRVALGAGAGTLRGSRLGRITIELTRAGLTALRHSRIVYVWLSGTLRSSGQRIAVAALIRLER